jgi:rare lipoprotein A
MKKFSKVALSVTFSLALCATPILPQAYAHDTVLSGVASWYGPGFHGRTTANGERYNMNELTAAHKSLKFGTKVRVTNANNGKSVVVRINDRGPYVGSRIIDLSKGAAQAIDMIGSGTASVKVEVLA